METCGEIRARHICTTPPPLPGRNHFVHLFHGFHPWLHPCAPSGLDRPAALGSRGKSAYRAAHRRADTISFASPHKHTRMPSASAIAAFTAIA